jgi:carbonic anhydrase
MKTRLIGMLLIAVMIFISACSEDETESELCDNEWSYQGELFPELWGLCYGDCDLTAQSPINITGSVADSNLIALNTTYEESRINLTNNGHAIEFEYETGSSIEVEGKVFQLNQFHFHAQSEHTVDGTRYPLEMHMVHQAADGDLVVVSVLFEVGAENDFLANFSDNLPISEGDTYNPTDVINVGDLIPANAGYYTYTGSLTTPPCSEIATWFVLKTPLQISTAQMTNFQDILKDNFRPIQDLNGRTISSFN